MMNPPEYAKKSALAILEALEASHLGDVVFDAGKPTPVGVYAVVSSIALAIGPADIEVVAIDGQITTGPQELFGVVIAGDIIVRFTAKTHEREGLAPDFEVKASSLSDLVAVSVKSGNLFTDGESNWLGQRDAEWPGLPEIALGLSDGETVRLPLSEQASPNERAMVARFVGRVPTLLAR
jgi:hypothetical protein